MLFAKRSAAAAVATRSAAAVAALLASGIIAGCGSSHETSIPVSARLVGATGSSPGQVILSQLGSDHIGLQTARARAVPVPAPVLTTTVVAGVKHTTSTPAPRPTASVIVPYSALVYDPTGKTYVFMQRSPLTFVEVPATVDTIAGNSAYLASGPKAGAAVVTVGAEELYGVQTGVLAQT